MEFAILILITFLHSFVAAELTNSTNCLERCESDKKYLRPYCNTACLKNANPQHFYCNLACEKHRDKISATAESVIDNIIATIGYEYCIIGCNNSSFSRKSCEYDCESVSAFISKCYKVCRGKYTSLDALCLYNCEWKKKNGLISDYNACTSNCIKE
ncbi:unnamed protein product [Schistosoma guineensis]|nr:unnamed protein product [Schistosoma guineensis]